MNSATVASAATNGTTAKNRTRIYLDNAATTPLRPEVRAAMEPFWSGSFGNASSPYAVSREARSAVDRARSQVAGLLEGAHADEIVFTGGGTESDNWALLGAMLAARNQGKNHVIVSAIEHDAVLEGAELLREIGIQVSLAPVDNQGVCRAETIAALLRPETGLVSVMAANNETGVVQPLREIGAITRAAKVLLHSDAVQAVGKMRCDVEAWSADLASLSAHKIGGPKGVGALWIRRGTPMKALLRGGGQERGRRAGTENVPAIVGFGAAAEIARRDLETNVAHWEALREQLENRIADFAGATINGNEAERAPHIVNFSLNGRRAESLALSLDLRGFAIGTGSACASGALEPSHVLAAMGLSNQAARSSLRVSLGTQNTAEEIDEFYTALRELME